MEKENEKTPLAEPIRLAQNDTILTDVRKPYSRKPTKIYYGTMRYPDGSRGPCQMSDEALERAILRFQLNNVDLDL